MLQAPFTLEDVKKSLFSMHGTKAPGPDGMSALFFQHHWAIVGSDLSNMVLNWANGGVFLGKFNFTLISLVPKISTPVNMAQFRPIALCNVAAKVVVKVLATRLKHILPSVILETQSAFVPQRLIIDNMLLSFEVHNFIK
ncbi:hypothetical protein LIER_16691 [Lithospermum erythrorhizon]|uniref:Reverse transcriptase domain-containing protein n=1 Tax=Lithospermum erythrorhizon TaxID=34254 RepID=A0AAV3QD13_LITER